MYSLAVAHVGHTGTDADRDRWLAACVWLEQSDTSFYTHLRTCEGTGALQEDYVDLNGNPRRDFLSEQTRYDIILIHNLWYLNELALPGRSHATACSPLHDAATWKRRLGGTDARYIFMFGRDFNASHLDSSLSGYDCLDISAEGFLSVFAADSCRDVLKAPALKISFHDMAEARLQNLTALVDNETLDLSYTNPGTGHLLQLTAMPHLKDLRLVGTRISDSDLEHVVKRKGLRRLHLDETNVGTSGLFQVRKLVHLECLSLNDTQVDDAGLEPLRELSRLEWLSLVCTAISDSGLAHLRSITSLRYLSIVGTRVTNSGVAQLRRALPECTIDFQSLTTET